MKVRFAADVLADERAWDDLDRMVHMFTEERHLWHLDDPEAIEASPWLTTEPDSRAARRSREALQKMAMYAFYGQGTSSGRMHALAIEVSYVDAHPTTLTPADARRALEEPAYVVVEDGESDRTFLDVMIQAFARTELASAVEARWIRVIHGGGSGVCKRVSELITEVPRGPRRILILADSDRMTPGEVTATTEKIAKCAEAHGVQAVILEKREIENYLPVGALQRVRRDKQRVYKAFLKLNQAQRSHYDMKHGFSREEATGKVALPCEQAALFQHVQPRTLDDLVGGFGKRVWEQFRNASDVITRDAVRATCADHFDGVGACEIENILDAVEALL